MNTFGNIKTKLENIATALYGKPSFKPFMQRFKKVVLENRDLSEIYFIYDDLSENKGLHTDIADEYLNESLEYCQILIESNSSKIYQLNEWLNKYIKNKNNNWNKYSDIDNAVYLKSIRNLETVLESKKQIKKVITSNNESSNSKINESINLPISTMVNIANKKIKEEINNLNENDKKEITDLLLVDYDDMKKEISDLKENIVSSLKMKLNESADKDLSNKIETTINKIMSSKNDHYNLYKLRNLNSGL